MTGIGALHFLRPLWLLALLGLPVLALLARRWQATAGAWRDAVDPHLLPHLLEPGDAARGRALARGLGALAYVLAVLALAGPSWRQVEQPLWQSRVPTVIAVDLSSAALAADLAPSRLARMRARLAAALQAHEGGPVGLVAFAGDAFTVAPLTEDDANVELFVDAMHPQVMPVDGQAADRAIDGSRALMERAGFRRGRIVLMTDHADAAAQRAAARAQQAGFTVSTLGVGTAAGASVRTGSGSVAHVRLDEASLRALARTGGGEHALLSMDGGDRAVFRSTPGRDAASGRQTARVAQDGGFWLLPVLMLLVLVLLLRRGAPAALVLAACLLAPLPSHAADLWRRPDQQLHAQAMQGIEAYRRGDFKRAAAHFARVPTADGHYNRGNALARAGALEDAIAAYDEALRRRPGMPDAVANRRAVATALERRNVGQGDRPQGRPGGQPQPGAGQPKADPGSAQGSASAAGQGTPPPAPAQQAQADAAQREAMERALQQAARAPAGGASGPQATPQERERRLSNEAALRRIPDEPGNLLREKFRLEHERRQREGRAP